MLRANSPQRSANIAAIVTDDAWVGLPDESSLRLLADALAGRNPHRLSQARVELSVATSRQAAARAVAVGSCFHMMNRILDVTGVPIDPRLEPIARELGFPNGSH